MQMVIITNKGDDHLCKTCRTKLTKDCRTVNDVHEMLKNLFRDTLQGILEAELEEHLGYKKHSMQDNNSGNSRNELSNPVPKSSIWGTLFFAINFRSLKEYDNLQNLLFMNRYNLQIILFYSQSKLIYFAKPLLV
ncbi:hypothetical protein JOC37_000504 [Desulfohalotomaculum tongense]|nr:hypothetical protein [Desulforadius tongensis]